MQKSKLRSENCQDISETLALQLCQNVKMHLARANDIVIAHLSIHSCPGATDGSSASLQRAADDRSRKPIEVYHDSIRAVARVAVPHNFVSATLAFIREQTVARRRCPRITRMSANHPSRAR